MRRALPLAVLVVLVLVAVAWKTNAFGIFGRSGADEPTPDASPDAVEGMGGLKTGAKTTDPAADPKTFEGDPVGRLDLKLGAAAFAGRVVGNGAPLRFARVGLVLAPPDDGHAVRTNKDGRFEAHGLPAGVLDLRVSAEGFWSRTVATPALADGAVTDLGEIELKPRPASKDGLEVKVTDPAGRPVSGAKVTASTLMYGVLITLGPSRAGVPSAVTMDATTDDAGVARMSPLQPEKYDVVVRAAGFAVGAVEHVVVAQGRVERVSLRLDPGLTMSGTVVERDGTPVANAYVSGLRMPYWQPYPTVLTDASGSFTLTGLHPGTYVMFAGSEEKGEGQGQGKAGDRTVRIELKGTGTLAGRVLSADGKPVPKFSIRPYPEQPFRYAYSRLLTFDDPDGKFSTPAAPGVWNVDVKAESGAFGGVASVTVEAGATKEVEIRLPAEGVVKGVVTDADGNHLGGSEVYVNKGGFPPMPSREQYARADADGQFVVRGLELRALKLHVRHEGFPVQVVEATPAPLEQAKEITVRLTPGARVTGKVSDAQGAPVAGAKMTLQQKHDFFGARTATTDDAGAYAFVGVGAGDYSVSATPPQAGAKSQDKDATVAGGDTVTVDFKADAEEAQGWVAGTVTIGGAPAKDVNVRASDERGDDASISVRTDADGKYLAKGLRPGTVTVRVNVAGGISTSKTGTIDKAGGGATVDVSFGAARVQGVVVAADGKTTVSGAWITLELPELGSGSDTWAGVKGQTSSDTSGRFSWAGVEPGTYRLRITGTGYAARRIEPFAVVEGETKDLGSLRLEKGGGVSGRVSDERGIGIENVGVSLKDAAGQAVFLLSFSSTGSDGRYAITGVELGAYTVRFEAKGYAPVEKGVTVEAGGAIADATLRHGGGVAATVVDDRDKPVEDARIELYDASGAKVGKTLTLVNLFDGDVSKTGAEGTATIPDLAPGTYTVRVSKEGFSLVGSPPSISISSGGTATVRLVVRAGT